MLLHISDNHSVRSFGNFCAKAMLQTFFAAQEFRALGLGTNVPAAPGQTPLGINHNRFIVCAGKTQKVFLRSL